MYSNSSLGAVARNVKIEDLEAVSSYDKTTYTNYGKEYSVTYYNKYYPIIFQQEKTGSVNGRYGSTLGLSDQTTFIGTKPGYAQATVLAAKQTYYTYSLANYLSPIYQEIFVYEPEDKSNMSYTFASRCVNIITSYDDGNLISFCVFDVGQGSLRAEGLYYTLNEDEDDDRVNFYTRPVVEIDLDSVTIGRLGDGSKNSQYSIEPK